MKLKFFFLELWGLATQRQHAWGKSQGIHMITVNIVLIILMKTVIAKRYCLCVSGKKMASDRSTVHQKARLW